MSGGWGLASLPILPWSCQARLFSFRVGSLIGLAVRASNEECLRPRFALSIHSHQEWPDCPSTARMGRAPFHRARSASKKGDRPFLPSHSCISIFSPLTMSFFKLIPWHSDCFGVPGDLRSRET